MEVLSVIKHSLVSDGVNPIAQHFRLVRQVASAGQEMVWKIYDAVRIKDGKEASVFLFEKRIADKLHKPKRREIVTDILRRDIINLSRYKHPKVLRVLHCLEECNDSLAFATEPVTASLANLLGNYDRIPLSNLQDIKDYSFIETEQKYGILQLAEALHHLHTVERILHMNISPENILITKKGMWKLAGFGFIQSLDSGIKDANAVHPWVSKQSKMAQPNLDFIAPEVQLETVKTASPTCDLFSFGMVICSIYNNGRSLIQAGYNPATYSKQLDRISDAFGDLAPKLPVQLVEPVERMINHDTRYRPSTQSFIMLKYFDDPVVHCMETMDSIDSRNVSQKRDFFSLLQQTIPLFPRKLLYNSVLKLIREQFEYPDMLVLLLPVLIALIDNSTDDDYRNILQHDLKKVLSMNRPVQATVYLLENLEVILAKVSEEETRSDILPIVFGTLDSNSIQGQEAAISVFSSIKKYIDDETMKRLVLPKAKALFLKSTNVRTKQNALECLNRLLDSLDKMTILEEVLPFLTEIQCTDVDIIMSVVAIYKHLLSDKKYGLTHSLLATKVMPTVVPLTVTPGLSIEQFSALMEVLHDMLDQIERQRLSKMVNEIPDHEDLEKRRTAIDMRNIRNDTSQVMKANPSSSSLGNKSAMLNIDGKYLTQSRQPSNPELIITNGSEESLQAPRSCRRHSSFQGLGAVEQTAVENAFRQRRASILSSQIHPSALANNPHILVSEPSVTDFKESSFFACSGSNSRRSSTTSTGPILVPDGSRRDSFGHIVAQGHSSSRRSSFQGICDSAMQLFKTK